MKEGFVPTPPQSCSMTSDPMPVTLFFTLITVTQLASKWPDSTTGGALGRKDLHFKGHTCPMNSSIMHLRTKELSPHHHSLYLTKFQLRKKYSSGMYGKLTELWLFFFFSPQGTSKAFQNLSNQRAFFTAYAEAVPANCSWDREREGPWF